MILQQVNWLILVVKDTDLSLGLSIISDIVVYN